MRWFVLLALTACSTQQRVTLGPTVGARTGNVGAEIAAEAVGAEGGIHPVISASGRLNQGLSGGGFRLGVEIAKKPESWGQRVTFTMGPTWIGPEGEDDGGATLDARASVALYHGWSRATEEDWANQERTILGVELFASSIGIETDRHDVLIGIGVVFGKFDGSTGGGWASVSPPPRDE